MKVFTALFAILLFTELSLQLDFTLDSDDDICSLFPDGAILRKPGTCDETIMCMEGKTSPNDLTCPGQGYKLETKKCAKVTDSYCADTNCKKNGDVWVADIKNCQEWVQCNGATKVTDGACPTGQIFDQPTQMCIYRTSGFKCDSAFAVCNVAPQDQPFWDKDNCHKYYICNKSQKEVVEECPIGHYYDVRKGTCTAKAQVDCYKHPYPADVCGTAKLAIRNRFVDDQATCRGYFYCADLGSGVPDKTPVWGQCPDDMFFEPTLEICKHREYVTCSEDRCDGRVSGSRELSETLGCQHYLECGNGYTIAEVKCPDEKYFDPAKEECVATKVSYPICA